MAFNPSEEHIRLFLEMAPNVTRKEIIHRIKGNNNNVEQALNEYYDDPKVYKYASGDILSDNEQEDELPENGGIIYQVQGADVPQPFAQYASAPSRPPSRINNIPHFDKTTYSSSEHTTGDDLSNQERDAELTKALVLSAQEAGLSFQETERSGISTSYFVSATSEISDSNNWSMITLGRGASMGLSCYPEPTERVRQPNTPAFLRPSAQNHYLAALITIYHQIPLLRNIFLNSSDVLDSYGFDIQWWAGKPIELSMQESSKPVISDIGRELQRLMAFLDDTERSYGSIDQLCDAPEVMAFSKAHDENDKDCAFLEAWRQKLYDKPEIVDQIFSAGVASEDMESDEKKFAILELTTSNHSYHENLYDICDECLWPELQPLDLDANPYLSHIAEVITFKIETKNENRNIEFPAIWYPDRYLKPSREASLEMRRKKFETQEEINKITKLEKRLTSFTKNQKLLSVKKMIEVSLTCPVKVLPANEDSISEADYDPESFSSTATIALNNELGRIIVSIDNKIEELNREKEILLARLRQFSALYTHPTSLPTAPKLKPYSLRGLCTSRSTMYICQRKENTHEFHHSQDDPMQYLDQWWRIHYSSNNSYVVAVEQTTRQKVLTAASEECLNPLLVYASEKALTTPKEPLPEPLKKFVQWDNHHFKNEIQEERDRMDVDSMKAMGSNRQDSSPRLRQSSPETRDFTYDDSNEFRTRVKRLERRNSENSNFDLDAPPRYSDEGTYSKIDNEFNDDHGKKNLTVEINQFSKGSNDLSANTPCNLDSSSSKMHHNIDQRSN